MLERRQLIDLIQESYDDLPTYTAMEKDLVTELHERLARLVFLPCCASQHLGLFARELATDCTSGDRSKSIYFSCQTGACPAIMAA